MGKRGKPKSKAKQGGLSSLVGGASKVLGGGGGKGMSGMSGGLYRVNSRTGEIIKVSQKKRRRGYRMPKMVAEQIRANNELTRNVSTAILLQAVAK